MRQRSRHFQFAYRGKQAWPLHCQRAGFTVAAETLLQREKKGKLRCASKWSDTSFSIFCMKHTAKLVRPRNQCSSVLQTSSDGPDLQQQVIRVLHLLDKSRTATSSWPSKKHYTYQKLTVNVRRWGSKVCLAIPTSTHSHDTIECVSFSFNTLFSLLLHICYLLEGRAYWTLYLPHPGLIINK